MPDLAKLQIFFGDANPAEARVYARLEMTERDWGLGIGGWKEQASATAQPLTPKPQPLLTLTGTVHGPHSGYARTLPATMPLVPRGAGVDGALLAEAVIPDPCFWSPESPFLHRVTVELRRGSEVVSSMEQALGVRPLGARGMQLVFESRPWVVRAICRESVTDADLLDWRDAGAAMLVDNPTDELLAEASRVGVVLLVRLTGGAAMLAEQLRRVSRWPAPALAIIAGSPDLDAETLATTRNLPLAQSFAAGEPLRPASWAAAVVCQGTDLGDLARRAAECLLPVIVDRPAPGLATLSDLRAECDRLQRDLAGRGDFAGYVV